LNRLIEIYGRDEVRRLDESSLPLLIGTDDTAHICLDAPLDRGLDGEGGIVAYVAESRNHLFLQPADDNQAHVVYHNDEPVTGSVWLKAGDTTRIGDSIIRWHLSGQRVEIRISKTSAKVLQPPLEPPVEPPPDPKEKRQQNATDEHLLPVMEAPRSSGGKARTLAIVLFALLLPVSRQCYPLVTVTWDFPGAIFSMPRRTAIDLSRKRSKSPAAAATTASSWRSCPA
jgi:hypothetical protein